MEYTNELNLTQPIVDAVKNHEYDPGECDITVTGLIDSPQIRMLVHQHQHELTEDISDNIWRLLGISIHNILESADTTGIPEKRLFADWLHPDLGAVRIGGKVDRCALLPDAVLQDYKLASVWEIIYGIKPNRTQQLNIYRWLFMKNGMDVQKLQNIFMLRDWKVGDIKRIGGDYPKQQVHVSDIPIWDHMTLSMFMNAQLSRHFGGNPHNIECQPSEYWEQPGKVAVMKEGRKTAMRVLDDRDKACEWIQENHLDELVDNVRMLKKGIYVEERLTQHNRCKLQPNGRSYCPVSAYCEQWGKMQRKWNIDDSNELIVENQDG